jgi:hypothetical protein
MSLAVGVFVLLPGCATSYHPRDNIGEGYFDEKTSPDHYSVVFVGNAYTKPQAVHDYAVLHAAEIAASTGFEYFVIEKEQAGKILVPPVNNGWARVAIPGQTNGVLYTPPDTKSTGYFASVLDIQLMGSADAGTVQDALEATRVISELRSKYKLP